MIKSACYKRLHGGGGVAKTNGHRAAAVVLDANRAVAVAKGLDALATWASLIGRRMGGPTHVGV